MINIEEYLNNFYRGTKNPTLKAMKYFLEKFNNFDKNMKFIHIAGTNGKGSSTEILANILIKQGYKVGKFMSPHLIRYNERININGKEISDKEISDIIVELQPLIEEYNENEDIKITLFELETIIGLLYFYRSNVDFVILETGLGGLYDCTNIITKPLVSIITSIGYDHMRILGNTLEEIAYQKAGIIKPNSDTVIFYQEPSINRVFINECRNKNNLLHIVKEENIKNYQYDDKFQYFDYKDLKDLKLNLKGKMQIRNTSLCLETIKILRDKGYKVDIESIKQGLETVVHHGRMEQLNDNPTIIFDGAHNEPAIRNLLDMVNMYYKNKKRVYIISILARKDYKKMLEILSEDKQANFIMTYGNDTDKFVSSDELYDYMGKSTDINKLSKGDLEKSIEEIMRISSETIYFCIGSFYTYANVVRKINEIKEK